MQNFIQCFVVKYWSSNLLIRCTVVIAQSLQYASARPDWKQRALTISSKCLCFLSTLAFCCWRVTQKSNVGCHAWQKAIYIWHHQTLMHCQSLSFYFSESEWQHSWSRFSGCLKFWIEVSEFMCFWWSSTSVSTYILASCWNSIRTPNVHVD